MKEKAREIASKTGQSAKKLAFAVKDGVKKGGEQLGLAMKDAQRARDKMQLRPIFKEDFSSSPQSSADNLPRNKRYPNMIRIVDRDRKYSENEVCVGSIGHRMKIKNTDLLHIFDDSADQLGLQFYPEADRTFYYKDPYRENFYVALDDYFDYLKKARVSELEMIAQNLGAKRVRIAFKERRKTFVSKRANSAANGKWAKAGATHDKTDHTFSNIEIAADIKFSGHDAPAKPTLVYFKNEDDIKKLVEMRINTSSENRIESKTYRLEWSKSSGIKEKEAAEIDAVLGHLKYGGTASISSEAQRENRTILEYSIEF